MLLGILRVRFLIMICELLVLMCQDCKGCPVVQGPTALGSNGVFDGGTDAITLKSKAQNSVSSQAQTVGPNPNLKPRNPHVPTHISVYPLMQACTYPLMQPF